MAQPEREDLFELCKGAQRALLDAGHRTASRRPEPDCERHGLIVLEQQWGQRRPGDEAVTADRSAGGLDRVPQVAQPFDVVAHRAGTDLEPLGEFRAGPVARCLEEREQA